MKSLRMLVMAVFLFTGVAGCETPMRSVLELQNQGAATASETINVPEKGTYYLYSSVDPKKELFRKDLKKGDPLGFTVHGDRARAVAGGTLVELSDYSDGASYYWKIEEKKK